MDQYNNYNKHYMVEFDIPQPLTEDFLDMVPEQRMAIDDLFSKGAMLSYTVSSNRRRVWAVMTAESESKLLSLIDELPMTSYMDYDYSELMFYNTVHQMPAMSLN